MPCLLCCADAFSSSPAVIEERRQSAARSACELMRKGTTRTREATTLREARCKCVGYASATMQRRNTAHTPESPKLQQHGVLDEMRRPTMYGLETTLVYHVERAKVLLQGHPRILELDTLVELLPQFLHDRALGDHEQFVDVHHEDCAGAAEYPGPHRSTACKEPRPARLRGRHPARAQGPLRGMPPASGWRRATPCAAMCGGGGGGILGPEAAVVGHVGHMPPLSHGGDGRKRACKARASESTTQCGAFHPQPTAEYTARRRRPPPAADVRASRPAIITTRRGRSSATGADPPTGFSSASVTGWPPCPSDLERAVVRPLAVSAERRRRRGHQRQAPPPPCIFVKELLRHATMLTTACGATWRPSRATPPAASARP